MRSWLRRHPLLIAYLLMGLIGFAALTGIRQESASRRGELCHRLNDQTAVIKELVDIATTPRGSGVALTQLPEFDRLDPDTQAFFVAIQTAQTNAAKNGRTDTVSEALTKFAREKLVPTSCG